MQRKPGFYAVKICGRWSVAEYTLDKEFDYLPDWVWGNTYTPEDMFDEISDVRIPLPDDQEASADLNI